MTQQPDPVDAAERSASGKDYPRDIESRYQALFEALDAGLCIVEVNSGGPDGKIDYRVIEANPAFFRHTGFEQAILGQWLRQAAPGLEDEWFEIYGRVARSRQPERFEHGSDHLGRWFDVYAFPVDDSAENRVAILFNDISGRRAAEARMAESELRFRNMADSAPVMMWVTDPTGFCTHLNRRWYEYTGQEPGSGEGYGWLDAVHPDDRPIAEQAFVTANAQQRDYRVDFRLKRSDGVYRWTIDAAAARFGDDGEYLGYVGSVIDIDERREAEAAIQVSEERLRLATEHAEIGFWDVDIVHDALIWPPRVKAMFGISPDVPVTLADFYNGLHPDDREKTIEAFERACDPVQRALYEVEYRTVGKEDGKLRWVAARGRGIFDDQRCVRIVGVAIEITERKLTENALRDSEARLRELNESLEHRVSEEVGRRAVAEEALRQSQKLEAMGQLTGGVAHDFNNLLTPIVGSLDMLQRKNVGDQRDQRLIEGALQSAERARMLVQRLLAFARRQPLQPVAVDLEQVIKGMAELVSSTTGPQVQVMVDVASDLPPAIADPNQLEMALLNLAVNARDAMPDGGTLTLSASLAESDDHAAELAAGRYIKVSVTDTGVGMDAATLARAIEPFFSTKGLGKGTGLGLSMVHGLATQLGGTLTIDSRPGKGTAVNLWLPVTDSLVPQSASRVEVSEHRQLQGMVLLVDDEDLVRASTAAMLADLGYEVVEASSAEDAIELIESGLDPELLVSDHLMPGLSGTQLARIVQQARPSTRILIISGYAQVEGIAPDLPRLSKPFRQDQLAAMLSRAVAGEPAH